MNFKQKMARLAAIAIATGATVSAHAADTAFDTIMAGVDLSSVATKVGATMLVVVGIALAFKGGDIVKRVIRKV